MEKLAVIFDLFGTLVRPFPDQLFSTALAKMADAIGLGIYQILHLTG